MAPPRQSPGPPFQKDERVLCFHMEMLYEAKILDTRPGENGNGWQFKIHYKGWKASWDDWVPQDRVLKFTDENKELARQLLQNTKSLQPGKSSSKQSKKAAGRGGSELGSARGSEERVQAQTAAGRGPRRARDFDLEQVSGFALVLMFDLTRKLVPPFLDDDDGGQPGCSLQRFVRSNFLARELSDVWSEGVPRGRGDGLSASP